MMEKTLTTPTTTGKTVLVRVMPAGLAVPKDLEIVLESGEKETANGKKQGTVPGDAVEGA